MIHEMFQTHNNSSSLGPLARPALGPLAVDLVKIDKNLSSLMPSNMTVFEVLRESLFSSFFKMTGALLELSFDMFQYRRLALFEHEITLNTETNWNPIMESQKIGTGMS